MIAMAAAREGVTASSSTPDAMQKVFDEGRLAEREIIDRFCRETRFDFSESVATHYLELGTVGVAGHIDGLVWFSGLQERVIEVKFLGEQLYREWEATQLDPFIDSKRVVWPEGKLWDKYAWQSACYHHATGKPVVFVVGQKVRGDDGSVTVGDVTWKWLDQPLRSRVEMLLRAREIDGTVAGACTLADYPCSYYFLHEKPDDETRDVVNIEDYVLETLVELYNGLCENAAAADKAKKTARKELDALLEKMDLRAANKVARVGAWQVEWIEQVTVAYEVKAGVRSWPKVSRNPVAMPDDPFEGLPGASGT